ncbi:MAG: hypothetical protein L0Z62_03055, partial [Gemmataceae bacterium]|nr:hypothetical protein [Gemmataceae bacterium]
TVGVFLAEITADQGNDTTAPRRSFFEGTYQLDIADPNSDGFLTAAEFGAVAVAGRLTGTGVADLDIDASFFPEFLPSGRDGIFNLGILADVQISYTTVTTFDAQGNRQDSSTDRIVFGDVRLDLGRFYGELITPIFSSIQNALQPVRPIVDFLTEPLPVVSELFEQNGGAPVTVFHLAKLGKTGAQREFLERAEKVVATLDTVLGYQPPSREQADGETEGIFSFESEFKHDFESDEDMAKKEAQIRENLRKLQTGELKLTPAPTPLVTETETSKEFVTKFNGSIDLPFLTNHEHLVRLLLGDSSPELFTFSFDVSASFSFEVTVPIVPLLSLVNFEGGFEVELSLDLDGGYDALGIRQLTQSLDFTSADTLQKSLRDHRLFLANGFYLDDHNPNHIRDGDKIGNIVPDMPLAGAINSLQPTLYVPVGSELGGVPYKIQIDDEILTVLFKDEESGLLTVVRGVDGTTAAAHARGAPIQTLGQDDIEEPEATLRLEVSLGFSLGLDYQAVTVKGGLSGVFGGSISADLNDLPDALPVAQWVNPWTPAYPSPQFWTYDGRVRLSELAQILGAKVSPFNLSGEMVVGLDAFVEVSLLGLPGFTREWELARFPILSGNFLRLNDEDIIAGRQLRSARIGEVDANGTLRLYLGDTAGSRQHTTAAGRDSAIHEQFVIESLGKTFSGGESLKVTFHERLPSGDPNPDVWGVQAFHGVKRIEAVGGSGNDWIQVKPGVFTEVEFQGGDGNDVLIYEGSGPTTLRGGLGNDQLRGGWGHDRLHGDDGNDTLDGGSGNDLLEGWVGADQLNGGGGHDTLYGNSGNDVLTGGDGNDELYGNDHLDVPGFTSGNDKLFGQAGDDFLSGGIGNDYLDGGDGNDRLQGGVDQDTLVGGAGHDDLDGSLGNDSLDGGTGNDTLHGGDTPDFAGGRDTLRGGDGDDRIHGGVGNDYMEGGAGNDWLHGGWDNDSIYGGAGHDTLIGDLGNDVLGGADGNDSLDGGQGADSLYGGNGNDTLFGGGLIGIGRDYARDILNGGPGFDRITKVNVWNYWFFRWDAEDTISGAEAITNWYFYA